MKSVARRGVRWLISHDLRGVSRLRRVTDGWLAPAGGVECRTIGPCSILLSHQHLATRNMAYGAYEKQEIRAFERLLRPGDAVADVGANVGYLTAHFSRIVGRTGRVFAFEPAPTPLVSLSLVASGCAFGNIEVLPVGVSDRVGVARYFETDVILSHGYGRIDVRPSDKFSNVRESEVTIVSLDDFFMQSGRVLPRLVKLDVEGQEQRAILGMRAMFDSGARPVLMTEVTVRGEHLEELRAYSNILFSFGYQLELPESPGISLKLQDLKPDAHRNVLWVPSGA